MRAAIALVATLLAASPATAQPGSGPARNLEPTQTLAVQGARGLAVADLDGDGRQDLAVAATAGVFIFVNSPDERGRPFNTTRRLVDSAARGTAVAAEDLDANGAIDLVVARAGEPSVVLFATAPNRFEPVALNGSNRAQAVALGDVDGDSLIDIALTGGESTIVYRNLGARLFAPPETVANGEALAIAAADFTGEGRAELVISRRRTNVEVYRRTLSGYVLAVAPPSGTSSSLAAADLDGDLVPDLAVGSRSSPGAILFARPGGSLSFAPATYRQMSSTLGVLLADFDMDGRADLVTIGADGVHRMFRNDGAAPPAFALQPHRFIGGRNASASASGLFDLNDVPDVAVVAGSRVEIFVNVGQPWSAGAPRLTLNGEATITLTVGNTYLDPGATAFDDVDGDLTSAIVVDDPVDPKTIGSYVVTYTVADSAGNKATATRTVEVQARAATGGGGGGALGPDALAFLCAMLALASAARSRAPAAELGSTLRGFSCLARRVRSTSPRA